MIWRVALGVAGIGGIGAFVFWSLYRGWLAKLGPINLTKQHYFELFKLFLVLTFIFASVCVAAFLLHSG